MLEQDALPQRGWDRLRPGVAARWSDHKARAEVRWDAADPHPRIGPTVYQQL